MKPRTLLVLLALVVGLGAFVWFFEREQPGSEEREKLANRVLGVEREDMVRPRAQPAIAPSSCSAPTKVRIAG